MESDEGVGGALSCVRACLSLFFAVGCVHDEPDRKETAFSLSFFALEKRRAALIEGVSQAPLHTVVFREQGPA